MKWNEIHTCFWENKHNERRNKIRFSMGNVNHFFCNKQEG